VSKCFARTTHGDCRHDNDARLNCGRYPLPATFATFTAAAATTATATAIFRSTSIVRASIARGGLLLYVRLCCLAPRRLSIRTA